MQRITRRKAIAIGLGSAGAIGAAIMFGSSSPASALEADRNPSWTNLITTTPIGGDSAVYLPPPYPWGIGALNKLTAFCTKAWVWLDPAHTIGQTGNAATVHYIPLPWIYLDGNTNIVRSQQNHSFEPNENHKIAPIMLDLANFPGGDVNHATSGKSYYETGKAALYCYEAFLTPGHPLFCNFLTDWKDQSILGYPTPHGNQNLNPGYSFTPNGDQPSGSDMQAPDGQLYGVYSAAAYAGYPSLNPARHMTANLRGLDNTASWSAGGFIDEQFFLAMNRFLRQDWVSVKNYLDGAIDASHYANAWDGMGFGGAGNYRGEYLGMYLACARIVAPVLRGMGFQLNTFDSNDHSPIWDQVENVMWTLWANYEARHVGGGIPGTYTSLTTGAINFDNEGNIAATYPYAPKWHDRMRNVALSGIYNASSQPGVPGNDNSIMMNGYPTPDGSSL